VPELSPGDSGRVVLALLLACQAVAPAPPPKAPFDAATFDAIVMQGVREGVFPGAALVIGRRDTVFFKKGYGHLTWSGTSPVVEADSTLYDLASLTKVLATTTSLMILVDRGKVSLDAPVATYVPEFHGTGTGAITVRHLLTHTSGLRPTLPLHNATSDSAALRMVFDATPVVPPGSRVVYSDLNAILLGEIVHRASGEPLDVFARREVFVPLDLQQTVFRPSGASLARVAPTGIWRGHPIGGVVNDQNAARLGGVAGHAGLFSTGTDVARFAQFILRGGRLPDGRTLVRAETVRLFTTRAVGGKNPRLEARALGWQAVPTGETVSSAGTRFGPRSFGHTGWTGTSIWIDPDRDLFVVLLTNRAFAPRASRSFTGLKQVRGRLADAAAEASDAH